MKKGVQLILFSLLALAIGYLFLRDNSDDYKKWQKKIDRHAFIADSLGKVIKQLDQRVYAKDSMLLAYMQTLNKSLYELDREASKDKAAINQNEQRQAEILKSFCDNMDDAHKPDFCK